MTNITIKTIARELNISTAAVSKALRDSHEIGAATKKRVQEVARQLNYIPNAYAGSLRKKKSNTIAVVLPEVADSFFSLAINGIESVAIEKGYHVLIYLTHEDLDREMAILKDLQNGRVDGVLMSVTAATSEYDHIHELTRKEIPLVFFDRVCEETDTAKITTDDFESARKATQHLIDCGCRRIALLSISDYLSISNKRLEGYQHALKENKAAYKPLIISCDDKKRPNRDIINKLLNAKKRPDGLIATAEKLTTDIYLSCRELKLRIPKDIKVVSFSNLLSADILNPSLTTITQPAFEMGKAAASALFKALEKKNLVLRKESMVISSELIVRESTGE